MERDRVMQLTGNGAAAIAVVRLAGPGVRKFLAEHFSRPVETGRCVHGKLFDGQRIIDDPVIVPTEKFFDVNLHGGQWIVQEFLQLAKRSGFEIADDLFDSDDIIEREMLEALPHAGTQQAICLLLAQPKLWKQPIQNPQEILNDRGLWWLLNPPRIAIVGVPNVGKSTLANALFGQQRSITANIPGTTRDFVGDWANLDDLAVHLLDTPGQRDSADPIEQAAIKRSRDEIAQADLVIVVLDPTQPLEPEQSKIRSAHSYALTVINKSDLPATWDANSIDAVHTIASRGIGIDGLLNRIRSHFNCEDLTAEIPRWWTKRQEDLLRQSI